MRSMVVDPAVVAATDAAREAVDALVGAVSGGALGELGHDELTGQLQAARSLAARLEWVSLRVVREVDSRGSHVLDAALSPAAWLRHRARMSPGEAKAAVRTARALADGPLAATSAALAGGGDRPGPCPADRRAHGGRAGRGGGFDRAGGAESGPGRGPVGGGRGDAPVRARAGPGWCG